VQHHFTRQRGNLRLYFRRNAADTILPHPAIDAAAIIANQGAITLDCLNQMQVDIASHAHKHNVANLQITSLAWLKRNQIAIVDFSTHGMTMRAYLRYLSTL
jgi:hypothetical protein